jgi:hypothetical protein
MRQHVRDLHEGLVAVRVVARLERGAADRERLAGGEQLPAAN